MKCACCGRKKKLFESYENLGKGGVVCSTCSDIMYRIHDALSDRKKEEYDLQVKTIKAYMDKQKASTDFTRWFTEEFMKRNIYLDEFDKDF